MYLPKFLRPKYKTELLRLGRNNDGGYCVPKQSIANSEILYSFGLSDDWSFEEDFSKKNSKTKIYIFDYSVNIKFWIKNFILNIIDLFKFNKKISNFIKDATCYIRYKIFLNKNYIFHIKKHVVDENKNHIKNKKNIDISLPSIQSSFGNNNYFLKIDIEGNEYRILKDILINQKGLEGLVIEFHNIDLMEDHIINFINKLTLDLVHVHVNNFGGSNDSGYAKVIEATFSKRENNIIRKDNEFDFPDQSIDQPNNFEIEDSRIVFKD